MYRGLTCYTSDEELRSQLGHGGKSKTERFWKQWEAALLPSSGMKGREEEVGGTNRTQDLGLSGGN